MENKIRISILLELYGKLLTEKQNGFMDSYYNKDYSLTEIADNNGITRQAVRTILLKARKKLEEYEENLGFLKKEKEISKCIEQLEETDLKTEQKKILNKMKKCTLF